MAGLSELAAFWSDILNVNNWCISVSYKRHYEMSDPDNDGETLIHYERRRARIHILAPQDRQDWDEDTEERILLHELLHVVLYPYAPHLREPFPQYIEEQIINQLVGAFVDLRDAINEPPSEVANTEGGEPLGTIDVSCSARS